MRRMLARFKYLTESSISLGLMYLLRWVLPVRRNKYIFVSMLGRSFGGNPKAFFDYLKARNDTGIICKWAFESQYKKDNAIKGISLYTVSYYFHLFTSQYIISDCRLHKKMLPIKRKGQVYVQTWHGTALKKVEGAAESLSPSYKKMAERDSHNIDIFISGSSYMTEIYNRDFWFCGKIHEIGTPRLDVFFDNNSSRIAGLKERLSIDNDSKLVLYAPTFRSSSDSIEQYSVDSVRVLDALNKKFGGSFVFLTRMHPRIIKERQNMERLRKKFPGAIDVSFFPDIQDLILVSDVLITDYSSCMFDFMYTGRPAFIYASDSDSYDRGFYMNLDQLPFSFSDTNDLLIQNIASFDLDRYSERINAFKAQIGDRERGGACQALYELLD